MLEVAMVYAAPDADLVRRLGSYIERNCRVQIDYSLIVAPHRSVVEVLGCALGAAAVILFVSPHSVPSQLKREEWEPLMGEDGEEQGAPTAYVTVAPASFPKVLLRRNAFDPSDETLCARALKRWILNLAPPAARPFTVPAGTAEASSEEIEALWHSAADQPGAVDTSAAVARAFIHAARKDFHGVLWIDARGATMACATGELGAQLSFRLAGELPENLADLRTLLNRYRCLVIIEQASTAVRAELGDLGLSSVLFVPSEELGRPTVEEARVQLQVIAGWIRNPQQVPPSGQMRHTMEGFSTIPKTGPSPATLPGRAWAIIVFTTGWPRRSNSPKCLSIKPFASRIRKPPWSSGANAAGFSKAGAGAPTMCILSQRRRSRPSNLRYGEPWKSYVTD